MIIQLAVISFIIVIGGAVKFLLPNFWLYLCKYTVEYIKDAFKKKTFHNTGEYIIIFLAVLVIGGLAFNFYKCLTALVAYLMTENLTSFFTVLRGIYTIREGTEIQNPFLPVHFWSGYVITPAIQFVAVYGMYRTIRYFMVAFNRNYMADRDQDVFEENDLLYFTCLGTGLIIWLELTFYSQNISIVSGSAHFIILSFSTLGFICYSLSISHLYLLEKDSYKNALSRYFDMSSFEKSIIYSPKRILLVTYLIGFFLHIPVNTGPQFINSNFLVALSLILCSIFFYTIGKKWQISKIYNFLGTAMMHESLNMKLSDRDFRYELIIKKHKRSIVWGVGILIILFLISKLELTFLLFFLALLTIVLPLLILLSGYVIGVIFAYIRTKYHNREAPPLRELKIYEYLQSFGLSFAKSTVPILGVIFGIFVLFSLFPKGYEGGYQQEETYISSVFGQNDNPLYIEYTEGNGTIPISYDRIPDFLLKLLYLQEDREFINQGRWFPVGFPKISNWHGISLATFYRYFFSGGGGSNLNMQLIKNSAFPDASYPQDIQRKFAEIIASYQLSTQMNQEEIVTEYLNKVAMSGGVGHKGLLAASLHVFDRSVEDINPLEMMYLVTSLKSGHLYKIEDEYISFSDIENYKDEIKAILLEKAERWSDEDLISLREFRMLRNQDLRFTNKTPTIATNASTRDFLIQELKNQHNSAKTFYSSLSKVNQKNIAHAVKKFNSGFDIRVGDAELYSSALVVDVESGKILGHHGGQGAGDLTRMSAGSPAGSLIKPFGLLELLEKGFSADLKLYDGPMGKSTPNNSNGRYSNEYVGISEILRKSLNAPMVNIREKTDPISLFRSVESRFSKMGISKDPFLDLNTEDKRMENILNYPIGSRNMSLYEIAQAYQVIFNNGELVELSTFEEFYNPFSHQINKVQRKRKNIYARGNALEIKSALRAPLKEGGTADHLVERLPERGTYYAKTGTTEGYKHGYTVLSDGDLLVVSFVSYGIEKNGKLDLNIDMPIPKNSGGQSAGILATMIYNQLN